MGVRLVFFFFGSYLFFNYKPNNRRLGFKNDERSNKKKKQNRNECYMVECELFGHVYCGGGAFGKAKQFNVLGLRVGLYSRHTQMRVYLSLISRH